MMTQHERIAIWRTFGASEPVALELVAYTDGGVANPSCPSVCPLADELFVNAWQRYVDEAATDGVDAVLCRALVQLHFPVATGISETEAYRAATRRGERPAGSPPNVVFARPDALRLFLHPTAAGRIPVIVTESRADFESLVQRLTGKNEPKPIPAAMGACVIAGYVNWERVATFRRATGAELSELKQHKEQFQDRLIVLSDGPYSSTSAASLGVTAAEWRELSLNIRLHHEATHYFTRRAFGAMRNNLLDELVADYMGIVAATGQYHAHWFLRFMGLEAFPHYRAGGRLENYCGQPPLSDAALRVLQCAVVQAAHALEAYDRADPVRINDLSAVAARITALTGAGLEQLASAMSAQRVAA